MGFPHEQEFYDLYDQQSDEPRANGSFLYPILSICSFSISERAHIQLSKREIQVQPRSDVVHKGSLCCIKCNLSDSMTSGGGGSMTSVIVSLNATPRQQTIGLNERG